MNTINDSAALVSSVSPYKGGETGNREQPATGNHSGNQQETGKPVTRQTRANHAKNAIRRISRIRKPPSADARFLASIAKAIGFLWRPRT